MENLATKLLEVGDPLTFSYDRDGEAVAGWLKSPVRMDHNEWPLVLEVKLHDDWSTVLVSPGLIWFKRAAISPTGPPFDCKPCGHTWQEHDDHGCLWMTCACSLPGERK